jgi:hypothetical protein
VIAREIARHPEAAWDDRQGARAKELEQLRAEIARFTSRLDRESSPPADRPEAGEV